MTALEPTVVEIVDGRFCRAGVRLFTTLEGENPSGSIKDHMVARELQELLGAGVLRPGDRVSEASAGSTAKALAYFCRELGLASELFVPDAMPAADVAALEGLGANVHCVPRAEGYARYQEFVDRERPHCFNQLGDHSKLRHYKGFGARVQAEVGPVDTVLGAVGTGHSLLGIAEGINPRPLVVTAEPAEAGAVPGIRNVELERYGEQDACTPELFDVRIVLESSERGAYGGFVETDHGELDIGPSFALVLSAVGRLLDQRGAAAERVLLVGAANRRRRRG